MERKKKSDRPDPLTFANASTRNEIKDEVFSSAAHKSSFSLSSVMHLFPPVSTDSNWNGPVFMFRNDKEQ